MNSYFMRWPPHAKLAVAIPLNPVSKIYTARLVYNLNSHSHIRPEFKMCKKKNVKCEKIGVWVGTFLR